MGCDLLVLVVVGPLDYCGSSAWGVVVGCGGVSSVGFGGLICVGENLWVGGLICVLVVV